MYRRLGTKCAVRSRVILRLNRRQTPAFTRRPLSAQTFPWLERHLGMGCTHNAKKTGVLCQLSVKTLSFFLPASSRTVAYFLWSVISAVMSR